MLTPTLRSSRATLLAALMLLAAIANPEPAKAIQLRWSSGSTDLSVPANSRVTLIVQADSTESALPNSWRLQWTADSSGISFVAPDSSYACLADTAKVESIDPPQTPADSAANLITAHFCSYGQAAASAAYWTLELVGGSKGKLKAVALDPEDSTTVIESNSATYNGGIEGDYAPLVLGATSVHQSLELRVTVVGADLAGATSLSIKAQDGSWNLPLAITVQGDSAMTGVASVAALLPECLAAVGSVAGQASAASLAGDAELEPDIAESGGCSAQYFEELLQPAPAPLGYAIQPKDFSLTPGFVDATTNRYALHLFYIRHNYWYYQPPNDRSKWHPELDEKNLGHAWTSDFVSWHGPAAGDKADTVQIKSRTNKFDELHVWAPTIVHPPGPTFYLFYTGVRNEGGKEHQRIGVATSTDLNTWTQADTVVLSAPQIPWAKKNPSATYSGSQQLRDPFVMEDPTTPGQWLMYFVAVDSTNGDPDAEDMAVGVATSPDLRTWTPLPKPFAGTAKPTFQGHTHVVESPHVFKRNGRWWMPYTVGQDQVFFETSASSSPTDTVANNWTGPVWLRGVSQGRPSELQYWHATEHLQFGNSSYEWLAAFDDNAISIDIKGVFATDSAGVDSLLLDCPPKPPVAGVGDRHSPARLHLTILRPRLGSPDVRLRMDLPTQAPVRLAVFDVAGRRLVTLVDRVLPAGSTEVGWNGVGETGVHLANGLYFARLTAGSSGCVSRVLILR